MIQVSEGQSLIDLTIQLGGNLEGVIELIAANAFSLDLQLTAGQEIEIPAFSASSPTIVKYLTRRGIVVNTGDTMIQSLSDLDPTEPTADGDFDTSDFDSQDYD